MKCIEALDALLVADRAALRGDGNGPLAMHVRGCPRCRRAAARIDGDTAAIGALLATRRNEAPRRHDRSWVFVGVPGAAAAALLLALGLHRTPALQSGAVPPAAPPQQDSISGVVAEAQRFAEPLVLAPEPVVAREIQAPELLDGAALVPAVDSMAPVDSAIASQDPERVAVAEASLSSDSDVTVSPTVAVRPKVGQHAAVFRTSDPKITIVWLY